MAIFHSYVKLPEGNYPALRREQFKERFGAMASHSSYEMGSDLELRSFFHG